MSETRKLISEGGLQSVTIEAVSLKTGIAKTTLYRRWKNAQHLAVAACLESMQEAASIPMKGSFSKRMEGLLLGAGRFLRSEQGDWLRQIIGMAQADPAMRTAIIDDFLSQRRSEARVFLQEARSAGEIEFSSVEAALDLMAGPLYHRFLMGHLPLTDEFAKSHSALVIKALTALQLPRPHTNVTPTPSR